MSMVSKPTPNICHNNQKEGIIMDTNTINQKLFSYIASSPTSFHAVASACRILEEAGFTPLTEQEAWHLVPGENYYVTRNDTSLFAFRMPRQLPAEPSEIPVTFQIVASHSDSPCFKLKSQAEMEIEAHYTKLNVEKYGSALLAPWFDRPLSVAGRVVIREGKKIVRRLINFDRDLAMIPSLAIHLNRAANDGIKYQVQSDLLPLIGSGQKDFSIKRMAAGQLQIEPEQILTMDLVLYNRMPGTIWGTDNEFISCPRLDDLQCAFASIQALCHSGHPDVLTGAAIFDNEEVGSQSRQGACSTFLKDCLRRISRTLGYSHEDYLRAIAGSFLVSADNGHALHPNYAGKTDPTNHPYLNNGVLIKFAANQKYTSDALTGSVFQLLCGKNGIPFQNFYNHSDVAGGSTLGNLSMSQVSIPTVDIGAPLLAMHSPYETGGAGDTEALYRAMCAFYQTKVKFYGDHILLE